MSQVSVQVERLSDYSLLRLAGRIEGDSSGALKASVRRELASNRTAILLDFGGVEFLNSTGLGALVSVMKEVRMAHGRLALFNVARYIREIFEVTQLVNIFAMYNSEPEAKAALLEEQSTTPKRQRRLKEGSQ